MELSLSRFDARLRKVFVHPQVFVIPEHAVMHESKAVAVNVTKERVIILVKLRIALCCHAGMPHDHVYTVRNVNLHLSSGNRALVNPQTVVEVVRNTSRVCAAHLTLSCESVQNFVLRMRTKTLLKVD